MNIRYAEKAIINITGSDCGCMVALKKEEEEDQYKTVNNCIETIIIWNKTRNRVLYFPRESRPMSEN